jgi:hypothetical protein
MVDRPGHIPIPLPPGGHGMGIRRRNASEKLDCGEDCG